MVTGASGGIGRGIGERLAQDAATVIVNYGKSAGRGKEVVTGIESRGGKAFALQADMSHVNDIRRLFQQSIERGGRVDVVVNNAGMFWQKPVSEVTEDEFDAMFALNTKGTFFFHPPGSRTSGGGWRKDSEHFDVCCGDEFSTGSRLLWKQGSGGAIHQDPCQGIGTTGDYRTP